MEIGIRTILPIATAFVLTIPVAAPGAELFTPRFNGINTDRVACMIVSVGAGERSVKIEVMDGNGTPVGFALNTTLSFREAAAWDQLVSDGARYFGSLSRGAGAAIAPPAVSSAATGASTPFRRSSGQTQTVALKAAARQDQALPR
jgi:hypothetical protein